MRPINFIGADTDFTKPAGWDGEVNGPCSNLPVQIVHSNGFAICNSVWVPTPEELSALLTGSGIMLSVVGHQPVVALAVTEVRAKDIEITAENPAVSSSSQPLPTSN